MATTLVSFIFLDETEHLIIKFTATFILRQLQIEVNLKSCFIDAHPN